MPATLIAGIFYSLLQRQGAHCVERFLCALDYAGEKKRVPQPTLHPLKEVVRDGATAPDSQPEMSPVGDQR